MTDTDLARNLRELQAAWEQMQQRYGRDVRHRRAMVCVPRLNGRSPWPLPADPLAKVREVAARYCPQQASL